MMIRQLFDSATSTFTYLLAAGGEAILIDPVLEKVDRDQKLISELGLNLRWILDTHVHADHVTAAGELRRRTGARTAIAATADVKCVDRELHHGDEISFGDLSLRVLATPGHTDSCLSFFLPPGRYGSGRVFTGDTLLVRLVGRTDFQGGSAEKMYHSVREILFTLPPATIVMPGHDYRGFTSSTVGEEMRFNERIGGERSLEEFRRIMDGLNLSPPAKLHEALPANRACGERQEVPSHA